MSFESLKKGVMEFSNLLSQSQTMINRLASEVSRSSHFPTSQELGNFVQGPFQQSEDVLMRPPPQPSGNIVPPPQLSGNIVPPPQPLGNFVSPPQPSGNVTSLVPQGLSTSSGLNELLANSELVQIFMKSCSRKNMAVLMTRRLFSEDVRMSSNVAGRNKKKLDPKIIDYIRQKVFQYFPTTQVDTKREWSDCIVAIDESSRRLKNKPSKHAAKVK